MKQHTRAATAAHVQGSKHAHHLARCLHELHRAEQAAADAEAKIREPLDRSDPEQRAEYFRRTRVLSKAERREKRADRAHTTAYAQIGTAAIGDDVEAQFELKLDDYSLATLWLEMRSILARHEDGVR